MESCKAISFEMTGLQKYSAALPIIRVPGMGAVKTAGLQMARDQYEEKNI